MAEVAEEDINSQHLKCHFKTKFLRTDKSFTGKTAYQHTEEQQMVSESRCIGSVGWNRQMGRSRRGQWGTLPPQGGPLEF